MVKTHKKSIAEILSLCQESQGPVSHVRRDLCSSLRTKEIQDIRHPENFGIGLESKTRSRADRSCEPSLGVGTVGWLGRASTSSR